MDSILTHGGWLTDRFLFFIIGWGLVSWATLFIGEVIWNAWKDDDDG